MGQEFVWSSKTTASPRKRGTYFLRATKVFQPGGELSSNAVRTLNGSFGGDTQHVA